MVEADRIFYGLANGRLFKPPPPPEHAAGGVLCVAAADGQVMWRRSLDAVLCRPALGDHRIWVSSRDGYCYCLKDRAGEVLWQTNLQSPIIARPAVLNQLVYVVSSGGMVCRLDASSGEVGAVFDIAVHTRTRPRIVSSPAVVPVAEGGCRLYIGAELTNESNSSAAVYCLRD